MRILVVLIVLVALIPGACTKRDSYIRPIDFNLLYPDSTDMMNGITIDQQQQKFEKFISVLRENTINHKIPDINITDLQGKSQNLKDHLANTTLLISTGLNCAFHLEGILNDFPKANSLIENPYKKNEIVLLILDEENDYFGKQYNDNIEEIKSHYSRIFLIDSLQSSKLNTFGLTRYYISKKNMVKDIGIGLSNVEFLKIELERNRAIAL